MSFDGNIVRHLTKEFDQTINTGRINKIYQLSKFDFLFVINSKEGKKKLLISTSPNYARTYLTEMKHETPQQPPAFCMFLRKQLESGIIKSISQHENDRIIIFEIQKRNELGDLQTKKMFVEVMGRYSNLIITDENDKILESIKHQMPFDGNERTIYPGAIYSFPTTDKINPYNEKLRNEFLSDPENTNVKIIQRKFMGFSPLISKEIIHRFENSKSPIKEVFNSVINEFNPSIYKADKDHFYFCTLTHIANDSQNFASISELLDRFYYNKDKIDITKQKSKDLVKFISNYINRLNNKIEKLNKDLKSTENRDQTRIKGELIQANIHTIQKGDSELACMNYYTNEKIVIPIDNKISPIKNSEKYFKKYKKLKTSIPHINKQIREARIELRFFYQIQNQIENASLKDIEEIKDELINKKYIKRSLKTKKRKNKPNFDTYYDIDGIEILVGKNNIQNAYITHKLAKFNEIWFHVKDAPGSHVVSRGESPLSETNIRTCAHLAAFFSKLKNSSSVPVDYVEVRHIKKVPGKINSFVTYKNNKTIYIDPNEDFIMNLNKK